MLLRKNLLALVVVSISVCVMACVPALGFLEDTPDVIERNVQNLVRRAKQGDSAANQRLYDELGQYQNLDLQNHSSGQIMNYIRRLEKSGSFPGYVFERGSYSYGSGTNYLHIKSRNVSMYSLPLMEASEGGRVGFRENEGFRAARVDREKEYPACSQLGIQAAYI